MQLNKWVHEAIWISKVKVIHWPWSKVTQIQHFQTSFPDKPLGRLKPNFMWSFNGIGERKFIQMVQVTWPRWPPCPYMVKTWKILFLWNQKADDLESLYAASGTRVLPGSCKWWLGWTWPILRPGQIWSPMLLYGKKVKTMDFSEIIVVYDIKVGRCSQLNEYMKLYEYQRSRSLIDLGPNLSDSFFLNLFSSITTRRIEAKCHEEPLWNRGMKACSNGPGHMTKMAAMPIYGKNHLRCFSLGSERPMTLKLSIQHWVLQYYEVCSSDAPGLTVTCFMARSDLVPYAFVWEKVKTMDFLETIIVYGIKVGSCSQLNESFMSTFTNGQGHLLTLVQITPIQYF